MDSIVFHDILSKERACLHIFDPIKGSFSGASYCSVCQFSNSYLRSRRYCYVLDAPILSLRSYSERHGIGIEVIEQRFRDLVEYHDSLNSYERIYFPSDHDVSHVHGIVSEETSDRCGCSRNPHVVKHPVGNWCLSPSIRCNRGKKMDIAGVVHTISEGSPSTSYATTCTSCSATVWHAGLGGQIIIFDILHLLKVDYDYGSEKFGVSFIDGRYFQEISTFTACRIWNVAEWCFTNSAEEVMRENPSLKEEARPETCLKLKQGIAKVESGLIKIDCRKDSLGMFHCGTTQKWHSWKVVYPSIHLDIVLPQEVSFLVNHLMYPRIIGRARPGHAVRAYGLWGIPDYAPRFNQAYLDSVRKRKVLGEELDQILDINVDIFDDPDSDFGDEGFSVRGQAEMDSSQLNVEVFEDGETGEHYYIDSEGNPRWLIDATQEELEWIYGYGPVEGEALPAAEDYEVVPVEEFPTATPEHEPTIIPPEDISGVIVEPEEEEVPDLSSSESEYEGTIVEVKSSIVSSVGGVLKDFSSATRHIGKAALAPLDSLNKSIDNFGSWLAGNDKIQHEYTVADFPYWVGNDYKHAVARLGLEINRSQEAIIDALVEVDTFRSEVLAQFKRIGKMIKKQSIAIGKMPLDDSGFDYGADLKRLSDRVDLVEDQMTTVAERIDRDELSKQLKEVKKRLTSLEADFVAHSADMSAELKKLRTVNDLRHAEYMARLNRKDKPDEPRRKPDDDYENYPVGGPAYAEHRPRKSYTTARSVPQMDDKPLVMTDKPDSVLPVNPDMLYRASAPKDGDHVGSVSPDLTNMTSSRYLIEQFKWNVVDNEHIVINTIAFPGEYFEKVEWMQSTSKLFQYFRCNGMEITVTMTSNRMQGGVLFCGWDSLSTCDRRKTLTIYEHYNLPHGLMTAGKNCELIFEVGFDTVQERMSLAGFELGLIGIGSLIFIPQCALVCTAETSQYCDISVYVGLRGPNFQVRTVPHDYKKYFDVNSLAQVLMDSSGAITSISSLGKLDFCKRNLIHCGKWTSTDRGRLCTLAVHPCIVKRIGRYMYPTALSMVSSLYHYWRGSLKYTFIFGGNCFTTGKLHVCAIPGQYVTDFPTTNNIMGVGGRVINLKEGDTHFEFTVPWYGVGDMQRTCRHTLFDSMYYGEDLVTRLHVWIVDPLITNVGATSSLSYAVTVEPGEDFELFHQRGIQSGSVHALTAEGPDDLVSTKIATKLPTITGSSSDLFRSWGHLLAGRFRPKKGVRMKIAPMYAGQQVDMNVLSWFSNFYTRWSGSLEYRFIVKPHRKNEVKYVYFWHMYEDPHFEQEYGYEGARLPPSGVPFVKWDLSQSNEYTVTVPFQSRFKSLAIPLSGLMDIKYHPTFYYNGVIHASYYGKESVDFNVYIRACSDYQVYGHGATTAIAETGGDVTLEYVRQLTSVEGTPVNQKNHPLDVVRRLFEDDDEEAAQIPEESTEKPEVPKEPKGKEIAASPSHTKTPPPTPKSVRTRPSQRQFEGQMDDGIIGAWVAKKVLGEKTAENLAQIDSEKVAKMVNWGCEASKFDFDALSGLVQKLVPLAENLNKRAEEAKVFTQEGARSLSFLGELSEMGGKLLELIKSLYKSSSLGWLAAQYDDGKITLAVLGTIALFIVGVMWWRRQNSMNWITKVGSIVAILWAPEIGTKAMDLYTWIVQKLEGVDARKLRPEQNETCSEAASSSLQSTISVRGEAHIELDFLDGMTDYAEVILSSILMVGSLFCLSMMPSDKTISSWTSRLKDLGDKSRAFTSIGGLIKMLQNWAKTISDCFMGWMVKLRGERLVGNDAQLSAMMKFGVADWVKRVSELSLEEEKNKQVNDVAKIQEIRALFDKGQAIKEAMLTHNFGAGTAAVFRDTINKVEKLINETYSAKGLGEPRIDPFHVAFIGKPGVGKSVLVQAFVKSLLDYMKYPQKDRIYSRSCADAFWSRYCRQPVVVYDDLGALTGDSTFSDYGEFINLKANVPYALNMAAVEDKGAMFQSHFLVSTSNAFFLDNNSNVRNPEAFYRRRDLAVAVERDPNVPKDPRQPTDGLVFTIVDTYTGQPRNEWPDWMGIEDGTFSVVRVPFRQFMVFTMRYCKGYMSNQKELLKTFKKNFMGEEGDELEVERILTSIVENRSGSGASSGGESEYSGDSDYWEARNIDEIGFQGAATLFPTTTPEPRGRAQAREERRHNVRQRNPRDEVPRAYEGQMDRYVTEEKPFYTSLELLGMYSKWEITGAALARSLQDRFGFHMEELYKCSSYKMMDHLKAVCTCTAESSPIECDGKILWDEMLMANGIYADRGDGRREVWLTSQIRGMNPRYRINYVPSEPWQIFIGMIQAVRLYTKHWGCPGQVFGAVDLMGSVDEQGEDEDDFVDSYEAFPVSVYDRMTMEDGISIFDRDDFKGTYPIVCGTFGGIPIKIGGHEVFIGKIANRRPGPVSDDEYALVRDELTRKSCAKVLEALIPAFCDMDIILMKQAVQSWTGHLSAIASYAECGPLKFVIDRLGWGTYGMVLFYMLLATKEGINKRILRKKKKAREEARLLAEGYLNINKEQQGLVLGCSGWMRKALVFGGLISAGVVVGVSLWGLWKGVSGFFGFVWNAFTPSDKSSESEKPSKEVPKIEAAPPPQPNVVSVSEVVKERYDKIDVELQAGTYGNSGDQKTRYSKRYNRRPVKSMNAKTRTAEAQGEVSTIGIKETQEGYLDGVDSNAMAHMQLSLGKEFGVTVNVPDPIMRQMHMKDRLLSTIEDWQEQMIKFNRVRRPNYLQEDGVAVDFRSEVVVIKGNTPFVVQKEIDPSWQGVFLKGRAKEDEAPRDMLLLESLKQPKDELIPFYNLSATIGDEVERNVIEVEAQGGGIADKEVLSISEMFEKSVVQVLTTISRIRFFGVMIVGGWMLIPAHFLMRTSAGEEIILLSDHGVNRMRLEAENCYLLSKYQDLALVYLGPRCPLFKDIRKHFISNAALPLWKRVPGMLMHVCYREKGIRVNTQFVSEIDQIDASVEAATSVYDTMGAGDHVNVAGLKYPAMTAVGWCGSMLISAKPGADKRILGIHTAGHTKFAIGYAELVTVEALNGVLNHPDFRIHAAIGEGQMTIEKLLCNKERATTRKSRNLKEVGILKKELVPKAPMKTDIVKSPIHGLFGQVKTEPSILSPFDYRLNGKRQADGVDKWGVCDPLLEAVEKYGEKTHSFPIKKLRMVESFLKHHYGHLNNSVGRRNLMSEDECINGIEFNDSYLPLNMDTSPGWPAVLSRKKGMYGKKFLFEQIESCPNGRDRYKLIDKEVKERMIEKESEAKQGRHHFLLTVECSKDERRKKKKIYEEVSTRSFTNLDVAQNLLYRKYFLNFGVMVQENFSRSFCKVGINVNGPEWSDLVQGWLQKSSHGFAGDYAKFDGIGDPDIFMSICRVVNDWYNDGDENARVREVLLYDAFHRLSLVRNVVVEINQGMPSGFPMTVIFNSIVNFYFLCMAWCDILSTSHYSVYASPEGFWELCGVATYGDDNVVAVPVEILEIYNLRTVAKWLKGYGISYTDDQKRPIEESERFVSIRDVTFLKRGIKEIIPPMLVVAAPLDKVSLEEQGHWIRQGPVGDEVALRQNLGNALYEASLHGKEYFDNLKKRLDTALELVHLRPVELTYLECQRRFWSYHMNDALSYEDLNAILEKGMFENKQKWADLCFDLNKEAVSLEELYKRSRVMKDEIFDLSF
ncbi:TPA_asm: polyprotein [Populus alba waikavirus]|uniref:Genome polyprotein n=1 Tax=Populus alba waikavirus TaxID=3027347 RepID=A0AA48P946_9SECO|nr:TPA_asm: polyprotein [Populus alba waikavirus]